MEPRELVQSWVDAFNRGDVDALADFYSEDATNHQVAEEPVVGRNAIRQMFATGFANAKADRIDGSCRSTTRGLGQAGYGHVPTGSVRVRTTA
jgi:uncharacterized protein (TIGR02246 family)